MKCTLGGLFRRMTAALFVLLINSLFGFRASAAPQPAPTPPTPSLLSPIPIQPPVSTAPPREDSSPATSVSTPQQAPPLKQTTPRPRKKATASQAFQPKPRPIGEICSDCRPTVKRRIFISTPGSALSLPSGVVWQAIAAGIAAKVKGLPDVEVRDASDKQAAGSRPTDLELKLAIAEAGREEASAPPPMDKPRDDGAAARKAEADRLEGMASELEQQASSTQASAASRTRSVDDSACGLVICMPTLNQAAYNACIERQNRCVEAASARAQAENDRIRMETEAEVNSLLSRARSLRSQADQMRRDPGTPYTPPQASAPRAATMIYELRWSLRNASKGEIAGGSLPASDVAAAKPKPRETLFDPPKPPQGAVPPGVDRLGGQIAEAVAKPLSTLPLTIRIREAGPPMRGETGDGPWVRVGDLFQLREYGGGGSLGATDAPRLDRPVGTVYRVTRVAAQLCELEAVGPSQKTSPDDRLEWIGLEKPKQR